MRLRPGRGWLAAALAFAFPYQPLCAAVWNVTTTADSGAGSLRQAILSSSAGDTISWQAGSGGMISLLSDLPSINVNTILDASAAPSAATIAGSFALPTAATVTFNNATVGQLWTVAANVSGAGPLIKTGAGSLLLSGSNSYSGGTSINGGVLAVTADSALGSGALTLSGGTLRALAPAIVDGRAITLSGGGTFDNAGDSVTLAGAISGTGGLTLLSTGTTILQAANTYAGGTTVTAGRVSVNSDANLGDGSGALTLNGGTLQTLAAITSTRAVVLAGAGGTIDTNGLNSTFSGGISGTALTKNGGGALALSGANTYSGGTTINAGTLQLGAANALGSGGLTIAPGALFDMNGFNQTAGVGNVTNNGQITVGSGRLSAGTYSGTGVLAVTLNGAAAPNVNAGGGFGAGGNGTLLVSLADGHVANNQVFSTVLTGANAGNFAVATNVAALSFTLDGLGNVTAHFVPLATLARNTNQVAVGGMLEPLRAAPTADLKNVFASLYLLTGDQLRAALDQIGPISVAAMSGLGMAAASVQSSALNQRMATIAGRAPSPSAPSADLQTAQMRSPYPGTLYAAAPGDVEPVDLGASGPGAPWGFFASALGTTGRLQEATSDAGAQPGYAFNTGGLTAGGDYRLADWLAAGLSIGYLHGHASVYAPASGTVDSQSARLGAYAVGYGQSFHSSLYLGGASDAFTSRRGIAFGNVSRVATGVPHGSELNVDGSVSYDLKTVQYGTFSPFGRLTYDRLAINAFTETGAADLDLTVGGQTASSLRSALGLRYAQLFESDGRGYTPYVSLGWRHEFVPQSRPINAQLASGAGSAFSAVAGNFARDGALLGVGLTANFSRQLMARFDYSGDFRSHFVENAFNGSVRFRF